MPLLRSFGTLTFGKMAAITSVDTASFMEEIQKYECLYNTFSKNFKNREIKENCWQKIAEKFKISKSEDQNKFKKTAYGRLLKKKKKKKKKNKNKKKTRKKKKKLRSLFGNHRNHEVYTITMIGMQA